MVEGARIPLTRPPVRPEAEAAVLDVLRSGHLVRGRWAEALEEAMAERLGVPHVVVVNSGTAALEVALAAVGLQAGDEVVMPDFTFPSLATAIMHFDAVPVTVDVCGDTYNATAEALLAAVTDKTRAVVPIHQFGLPAEVGVLVEEGRRRGFAVIEDAACALGAEVEGSACGAAAPLGCFSFHPRKMLTTGEGGAVACADAGLAEKVRSLAHHGVSGGRFVHAGWNFRMSDVHAAVGAGQLPRLDDEIGGRRRVAEAYLEALEGVSGVEVPAGLRRSDHCYQSFIVKLAPGVDRARVIGEMRSRGVETTIGSYAVHAQPVMAERCPGEVGARSRKVSLDCAARALALPMFGGLQRTDVDRVVAALRDSVVRWG